MKRQLLNGTVGALALALFLGMSSSTALAGAKDPQPAPEPSPTPIQHGPGFVDLNGDGFNDNAPDHDGDGIPNGLDEDWTRPQDGSGYQHGQTMRARGQRGMGMGRQFIDANGDGVCDRFGTPQQGGRRAWMRNQARPGGQAGVCDGSGPHGRRGGGSGRP